MKVNDLALIPDPVQRLAQAQRFLRELKKVEQAAMHVRDEALLAARQSMTQRKVAELLDVSQARVNQLEQSAKERANGDR